MLHLSSNNPYTYLSMPPFLWICCTNMMKTASVIQNCWCQSVEVISNEIKKTVFCLRASLLMRGKEFVFSNPSLLKLSKSFYFIWMRELPRARNREIILAVKSSGRAASFEATFKAITNSKGWDNLDLDTKWQMNTKNVILRYKIENSAN